MGFVTTIPAEATGNALAALGYLDVTLFGADPTGVADSTAEIQEAIIAARTHYMAVWFPNQAGGAQGLYKISDTLQCFMRSSFAFYGTQCNVLLGALDNGVRPKIILASGASGFNDINNPKVMINFWSDPQDGWYEDDPNLNAAFIAFYQTFRGIDIDCGGNAGAIGLSNMGAQGKTTEHVTINAVGAFAGIWGTGGNGSGEYDITVNGGRYSIYYNTTMFPNSPYGAHTTFVGCTFTNPTHAFYYNPSGRAAAPTSFVGCNFQNTNPNVPYNIGYMNDNSRGGHTFNDCVFDVNTGQLFDIGLAGLYLRNVYVRGANAVTTGFTITPSAEWAWVKEYSKPSSAYRNLINGVGSTSTIQTYEVNVAVTESTIVNALIEFHRPDQSQFPHIGIIYHNAKTVYGATGDGVTDDYAALQNAIDTCSTLNIPLFLPKGYYRTSAKLVLRYNTVIFGCSKSNTLIKPICSWKPSVETIILSTDSSQYGTTTMSDILVGNNYYDNSKNWILDDYAVNGEPECDQFNFTPIEWRVGRNSKLRDVVSGTITSWLSTSVANYGNKFSRFRVNGYGGGKWYSVLGHWRGFDSPATRIAMIIENTDEPLYAYPMNFGGEPYNHDVVTITNSSNKFFYHVMMEQGLPMFRLVNCNNIGLYASHKNHVMSYDSARAHYNIENCTNVVIAMANSNSQSMTNELHAYEIFEGQEYRMQAANIALFKRGDAEYLSLDYTPPPDPEEEDPSAVFSSIGIQTESDIVAGGGYLKYVVHNETIVDPITDSTKQLVIDGLVSNQSGANGWNLIVRPAITVDMVNRTADNEITIGPLPGELTYDISSDDVITGTIPHEVLVTNTSDLVAAPALTIALVYNPTPISVRFGVGKDFITFGVGKDTIVLGQ